MKCNQSISVLKPKVVCRMYSNKLFRTTYIIFKNIIRQCTSDNIDGVFLFQNVNNYVSFLNMNKFLF